MSPSAKPMPAVALLDVTEAVLERLLSVALHDADADEVTPPLGTAVGWDTERISWFRRLPPRCRGGAGRPGTAEDLGGHGRRRTGRFRPAGAGSGRGDRSSLRDMPLANAEG
jgi:hypothetical protein